MSVSVREFGELSTGEEISIYRLENKSGAYAEITQYGAILVKLCVPDKNGVLTDVVLGYDDLKEYETNACFFWSCDWKKRKPDRGCQIFHFWERVSADGEREQ